MQSMLRYFISVLLFVPMFSVAQNADTTKKVDKDALRQFRIGVDLSQVAINALQSERTGYEFQLDYYHKKELFLNLEFGFGGAKFDQNYLKYNSNNLFFRVGFDKSMLTRTKPRDWDMVFVGLRYGAAFINRGDATYTIVDSTWGNTTGTVKGSSFSAHWAEITGGVRVEVLKDIFLGWNVRGKFLINPKALAELPPSYIAGYGKGDKNTIFDYNFYLSYAIRWEKK